MITYKLNNRKFSDSFVFQLKDFLSSHPYLKNRQNRNSVFNNSFQPLLAEFQQYKKLKIINGQLNNETFRALGEEMSPMQMQMATVFQPELRYLFVGELRDGFINKSKSEFVSAFYNLWNAHRGEKSTFIDPRTGNYPGEERDDETWLHQCAINMSYALQAAGVNMSSYFANSRNSSLRNIYVQGKNGFPSGRFNLARDVYQLAVWVRAWYKRLCPSCGKESPKNKYWKPNEKWQPAYEKQDENIFTWLRNQHTYGIVVMYDHWNDNAGNVRGHIDLWNGAEFRRGEPIEVKLSSHIFLMPLF